MKSDFVTSDSGLLHILHMGGYESESVPVVEADSLDDPRHCDSYITENVTTF